MFVTEIRNIPYFDGHCDTIYECMGKGRSLRENSGHVDLMRGQRYGRCAQFFALFDNVRELPEGTAWTKLCQMHDWFCAQAAENADVMALCRTGAEVDAAAAQHKTAALLSIEGADLLDCDMAHLETAASWGVQLLNPVWNNANALCGSCAQEPERGLSAKGAEFVAKMEELGIHTDVSHISDAGFWDVLRRAKRPVVASHSNTRAICPHRRNLTDDMFRAIRDTGGVVGVNVSHDFVHKEPRQQTAAMLARHAAHMAEVMGPEHVACGFDFCEYFGPGYEGCEGMEDCGQAQNFIFELERIGFSEAERQAIASENLLRVLE